MLNKLSNMTVAKVLMLFSAVFFSSVHAQDSSLINLETGLNDLVYNISQSIVTIEATEPVYPNNYSGTANDPIYSCISTGLIFDTSGLVLTIAPSVIDRSQIFIRFEDKNIPAKLVGIDYQNGIALLKMHRPFGIPVRMIDHSGCAGQMVLAVGNSYDVRAAPAIGFCAGSRPDGLMQFTASFTPTTFGGGLFTLSGDLIGIITGNIQTDNKIGLALPTHKLREIVDYLLKNGDRLAGYLGLTTKEFALSPPLEVIIPNRIEAPPSTIKIKIKGGLAVSSVTPNSPASKSGLKHGDLIFQANGKPIIEALELANYVKKSKPGTIINFDFLRHDNVYTVQIPIGQMSILPSSVGTSISQKDMVADSILKEMEELKARLFELENRLKQLR